MFGLLESKVSSTLGTQGLGHIFTSCAMFAFRLFVLQTGVLHVTQKSTHVLN
jgi:hypothetical protein